MTMPEGTGGRCPVHGETTADEWGECSHPNGCGYFVEPAPPDEPAQAEQGVRGEARVIRPEIRHEIGDGFWICWDAEVEPGSEIECRMGEVSERQLEELRRILAEEPAPPADTGEVEAALVEAFMAGVAATGEGINGEYPYEAEAEPVQFRHKWIEQAIAYAESVTAAKGERADG